MDVINTLPHGLGATSATEDEMKFDTKNNIFNGDFSGNNNSS